MKCPNCRCIIPSNSVVCSYCGYELVAGCKDTYRIQDYTNQIYNNNYSVSDSYYSYGDNCYTQGYNRTYGCVYPDASDYTNKSSFIRRILEDVSADKLLLLIFIAMTYLEILLLCILFLFI